MLKDKLFLWTPEAQEAFDELKRQFMQALVLMLPDPNRPFQIESDASKAPMEQCSPKRMRME